MARGEATVVFTVQPVGGVGEWHENPAPQWIVVLSGRWFIESMDGTRIEQGPGEFSLGEDQGCRERVGRKGHRSGTVGEAPYCLMTVQLYRYPQRTPATCNELGRDPRLPCGDHGHRPRGPVLHGAGV